MPKKIFFCYKLSFNNTPPLLLSRDAGLTLALTVNPFVSTDSSHFRPLVDRGLFVGERNSSNAHVPGLTWFKGASAAAMIDVTNPEAVEWIKWVPRFF